MGCKWLAAIPVSGSEGRGWATGWDADAATLQIVVPHRLGGYCVASAALDSRSLSKVIADAWLHYDDFIVNLHHYDHDGRARFVTFCTHRKLPLLSSALFRDIVVDAVLAICCESGSRLLAYVVMPEHVHIVIVPPEAAELGPLVGRIKLLSAQRIIVQMKMKQSRVLTQLEVIRDGQKRLAFWQRRCYDHNCRTLESVWEKVNYCHNNPVKRGLASTAADYRWSSANYYTDIANTLLEIDVAATH